MSGPTVVLKPRPSSWVGWTTLVLTLIGSTYLLGELIFAVARRSLLVGKSIFILLTLITVCLFSIPAFKQIRSPRRIDIFSPPIVVFGFLSIPYLLRPLQMIITDNYRLIYPRFVLPESAILAYGGQALLYTNVGIALFLIGYYSNWGERLAVSLPEPNDEWEASGVRSAVLLFSLLSVLAVEMVVYMTAGSFVEIVQRWDSRVSMFAGYHLLIFLSRAAAIGSIALLLHYRTLRPVAIAHLTGATFLVLVFGRRAFALTLVLMFLVAYHYSVNRIQVHEALPLGFGIFSIASTVRYIRQTGSQGFKTHILNLPIQFPRLLIDDLGRGFDNFVVLLRGMPDQWSHQLGTTYLRVPLNFIPRALWPGKPALTVGSEFATRFFPGKSGGVPLDIFTLQYLNFHLFGIVIGLFVIGIVYRTMYTYLQQNDDNRGVILLYAITIITFRKGLTNNSLVTWIVTVGMALGLLFLLGSYNPRSLMSNLINRTKHILDIA